MGRAASFLDREIDGHWLAINPALIALFSHLGADEYVEKQYDTLLYYHIKLIWFVSKLL